MKKNATAKWQQKYGAIIIAIACLFSALSSWGNNTLVTIVLILGVVICSVIGFFDIKNYKND